MVYAKQANEARADAARARSEVEAAVEEATMNTKAKADCEIRQVQEESYQNSMKYYNDARQADNARIEAEVQLDAAHQSIADMAQV